jgi:phospholipid/cholesterol/gamma-HCH transport system permease protein
LGAFFKCILGGSFGFYDYSYFSARVYKMFFFFALIIVIVACHKGFNTKGGVEGVGKATTSSVMTYSDSRLLFDGAYCKL